MRLRPVCPDDVAAYVAMRCDPAMMAHLGGPQDPTRMPAKVARDVAAMAADRDWIYMVEDDSGGVAGTVTIWRDDDRSEIGWMVLPAFQGRGLARVAVREILDLAAQDGRWGQIHATPGIDNGPSNGICRALGFTALGEEGIVFGDRALQVRHWVITPNTASRPSDWQAT
jgi:RimJ/RimL family protein N-acetyltransferase